jgi:CheY-like chemotaxis protein
MAPRILMVEDEKYSRSMFVQLLRERGYEVFEADNGLTGMQQLREQTVDLVVTNMIMPEMDGVETIVAVRSRYPAVKILAISGSGFNHADSCLKIARALGAHKTLAKPLDPTEFLRTVEELLTAEG